MVHGVKCADNAYKWYMGKMCGHGVKCGDNAYKWGKMCGRTEYPMSAHLYYENCPSATVLCGVVFPGANFLILSFELIKIIFLMRPLFQFEFVTQGVGCIRMEK